MTGRFRPRGDEEASFIVREEDTINNSRGVGNPSPYGFPKVEGSVSAPSLTVGNDGFPLPTSTSTWRTKCAADWFSAPPNGGVMPSRKRAARHRGGRSRGGGLFPEGGDQLYKIKT